MLAFRPAALAQASVQRLVASLRLLVDVVLHPAEDKLGVLQVGSFERRPLLPRGVQGGIRTSAPHGPARVVRDVGRHRAQGVVLPVRVPLPPRGLHPLQFRVVPLVVQGLLAVHPSLESHHRPRVEETGLDLVRDLLESAVPIDARDVRLTVEMGRTLLLELGGPSQPWATT